MLFLSSLITEYLRQLLRVLADDEATSVPKEAGYIMLFIMFMQRFTFFYKSWGIFNKPYNDIKLQYLTKLFNWFTLSQLLTLMKSDTFNMVAMYTWFTYHNCLDLLQKKALKGNCAIVQQVSLFLFFDISLYYIISFHLVFKQLICERQLAIVKSVPNCALVPQLVNGSILYMLLLYQCFVYTYLYRNINLPVGNFLKKRKSPLTIWCMVFDFPGLLLQQSMHPSVYTVANFVKLTQMLTFFTDTWVYKPHHSRLNDFFLKLSSILLFNGVLFVVEDFYKFKEDQLIYITFIFAPLGAYLVELLQKWQEFQNCEEDILYWADELHVLEEEQKKDNTYQLRWVSEILNHRQQCGDVTCRSHEKIDMTDYAKCKQLTNGIVICKILKFINGEENKPQKNRKSLENIYLHLITYLSFECASPLKGYIQLKKYLLRTPNTTLFYKLISENLGQKLEFKSKQIQELQFGHLIKENYLEKLSIKEIRDCDHLWNEICPKILVVVDLKVKFWEKLMIGYQRIEEFYIETIRLSEKIWDVKKSIFSRIKVDPMHIDKGLANLNGIELKILSIVYTVVLNDYYGTRDIELKLDEMMAFERNLQQEITLNINILYEEVIVLIISILEQRGQIMNSNRSTLSNFLKFKSLDDSNQIQNVNQIIPDFFSSKHNQWIDTYLATGYSKLFSMQTQIFYKDCNKFIHCANLHLANIFDTTKDFLMSGQILQTKQGINFLLFDTYGRIIGMSKEVYEVFGECPLEQMQQQGYIFFWLRQIFEVLEQECQEMQLEENNHLTSIKTALVTPPDLEPLSKDFQRYIDNNQLHEQMGVINAKHQKNTVSNMGSMAKSKSEFSNRFSQQHQGMQESDDEENGTDCPTIMGFRIPFLQKQVRQQLHRFLNQQQTLQTYTTNFIQDLNNSQVGQGLVMKYQLSFNVVGNGDARVGFFAYHIMELRMKEQNSGMPKPSTNISGSHPTSKWSISQVEQSFNSEAQVNSEEGAQFNLNEPVINKLVKPLDISDQFEIGFDSSSRQDLPRQASNKLMPSIYNQHSQIISPRNQEIELIQEIPMSVEQGVPEDESDEEQKDSSQKDRNFLKRDLMAILNENKLMQHQTIEMGAHQSTSSATTDKTQNTVFNLLKVLQYKQTVQKSLFRIYLINTVVCLAMIAFVVVKVLLVQENLQALKGQILLIQSPNQFNQMFCHFAIYTQMKYLHLYDVFEMNDYEMARLKDMSMKTRKALNPIIAKSKNDFAKFQEKNELKPVPMWRIQGQGILKISPTFFEFVFYFNQEAFQQNKVIQSNETNFTDRQLYSSFTLRMNLLSELSLTSNLLEAVYTQFFSTLDANNSLYVIILSVEILALAIIMMMQIPSWINHYEYQQRILSLISRTQQKEAELMIEKLAYMKQFICDTSNKWKQTNFHQMYFVQSFSHKKQIRNANLKISNLSNIGRDNRSTLTSRIQETKFSYLNVYASSGALTLILQLFLIGMYFYTYSLSESTRPQLGLSMDFVKFKYDYDNLNMMAYYIKTQPFFEAELNKKGQIEYIEGLEQQLRELETNLTTQFTEIYRQIYQDYDLIYGQIIKSGKISDANRQILLTLYQDDICLLMNTELPFCEFKNGKFQFFSNFTGAAQRDDYRQALIYGMTGLIENLMTSISSAFAFELQNQKYDPDTKRANLYLHSKEFTQLVWSYYIDLYKPFFFFEESISSAAMDILDQDFNSNTLIHVILCVAIVVTIGSQLFRIVRRCQLNVQAIRQSLVNLPFVMLLDPQTVNQIKRLESE